MLCLQRLVEGTLRQRRARLAESVAFQTELQIQTTTWLRVCYYFLLLSLVRHNFAAPALHGGGKHPLKLFCLPSPPPHPHPLSEAALTEEAGGHFKPNRSIKTDDGFRG